ncbi:hypothetical protein [Haliscomenobacter sp.]|uniref:hypothetical protein n=1 Tax=Haliscomenobacter sp. TaxID=2717303 RepID=UPI003BABD6F0
MRNTSTLYLILLFAFVLHQASLSAQSGSPFVLRLVAQKDPAAGATDPKYGRINNRVVQSINKTKRAHVNFGGSTSESAAAYLLEIAPSYKLGNYSFIYKKHVDSIETVTFAYSTSYTMDATLMVTDISKGSLKSYHTLEAESTGGKSYDLSYKSLGLKKGLRMTDSLQKVVVSKALPQVQGGFLAVQEGVFHDALNQLGDKAEDAPFYLFPVKLPIGSMVDSKKDKVEKVSLPGLAALGLDANKPIVAYEIVERKVGKTIHEQYKILATLSNKSSEKAGEVCKVDNGEKTLFAAMQSGTKIWCSPFVPTVSNRYEEEIPGIALLFIAPKISREEWEKCYIKLRTDFIRARGTYYPLIDRTRLDLMQREKNLQKADAFVDKAAIQQFKSIGAGYLLEVKLNDMLIDYSPVQKAYKFKADFVTRLIHVSTSEVLAEVANTFADDWSVPSTMTITPDEHDLQYRAIAAAPDYKVAIQRFGLENFAFNLREVLNRAIPQKIEVLELLEEKKENAESLLIAGNFNASARHDDFFICRKKTVDVDGEQLVRMEQLGIVSIKSATGDGLAITKVKKGEKEIYKAIKAGDKLFCIDKPEWFIDGQYTRQLKAAGF